MAGVPVFSLKAFQKLPKRPPSKTDPPQDKNWQPFEYPMLPPINAQASRRHARNLFNHTFYVQGEFMQPLQDLDCYWVGSLDFNFLGNQGVFHASLSPKEVDTFCRVSSNPWICLFPQDEFMQLLENDQLQLWLSQLQLEPGLHSAGVASGPDDSGVASHDRVLSLAIQF